MPMAVTAALAFSSATLARSSAWLVVVASLLKFELHFVQLGCLSRELSGHPHELFGHAL